MNLTDDIIIRDIQEMVDSIGSRQEHIVALLHAVHEKYHYLPEAALECLARTTDISPMTIAGVATFYSQFRLKPAGKHCIKVCIGTACHVKGAMDLYDDFKKYLDIPSGEDTDQERLFTVSKVACLGCCMLAPAVQIDDITYGPVSSAEIPAILRDFLESLGSGRVDRARSVVSGDTLGTIKICTCSSCRAAGSGQVFGTMKHILESENVPVELKNVGCTGISSRAPLVEIETAGVLFVGMNVRDRT